MDDTLLSSGSRQLSFAELARSVNETARWLEREVGATRGQRIVLALESSLDHLELLLAACSLGCQVVVVAPTVSGATFAGIVASMKPAAVAVDDDNARLRNAEAHGRELAFGSTKSTIVRALPQQDRATVDAPPANGAPLLSRSWLRSLPQPVFFTSGSTSSAKGVVLEWPGITERGDRVLEMYGAQPGEWLMPILPLSHVYGLYLVLGAIGRGVSCVFERESVRPATLGDSLVRHGVGYVVCPPLLGSLLFGRSVVEADIRRHLRVVSMGGAATTEPLARKIVSNLPGVRVFLSYGLVETYSTICANEISLPDAELRSVGPFRFTTGEVRDLSGTRLGVGEIGELCIAPPITSGYFVGDKIERDGYFTADGLFRTGDLASIDERGFVTLRGRHKEMINAGGLSIAPDEVEEAIKAHPMVADCGVFAEEQDALEFICAAVVLHADAAPDAIDQIFTHCRSALSPKMVPRRIVPLATIPRGALGKIQRAQLRALCTT